MSDSNIQNDRYNEEYDPVGRAAINILDDSVRENEIFTGLVDSLASMRIDEKTEGNGFLYEMSKAQINVIQVAKGFLMILLWALYSM